MLSIQFPRNALTKPAIQGSPVTIFSSECSREARVTYVNVPFLLIRETGQRARLRIQGHTEPLWWLREKTATTKGYIRTCGTMRCFCRSSRPSFSNASFMPYLRRYSAKADELSRYAVRLDRLMTIVIDSSAVSMVSQLLMRGLTSMYTCHVSLRTAVPRRCRNLREDQARSEKDCKMCTYPPIVDHS
jgi:hypothetical protein